jgi:hypothetical protein
MPVRSAQQRAARQAALKAKMHAANPNGVPNPGLEVLPPLTGRSSNGQFAPGNKHCHAGMGRPRDKLVMLCQSLHDKHKLMQEVCLMSTRKGRYAKIDYATQLRAIVFLTERAFGPPPQTVEVQKSDDGYLIKRIIGVRPEDI